MSLGELLFWALIGVPAGIAVLVWILAAILGTADVVSRNRRRDDR